MSWRVISIGFLLAASTCAKDLGVCWQDRVGIDPLIRQALTRELRTLLEPSENIGEIRGKCAAGDVAITLRFDAPPRYPGALGLAYRDSKGIAPRIEIYWNPTLRHLGAARARHLVGRALARVAAHELAHYLLQQPEHHDHGLLAEGFKPSDLGSAGNTQFQLQRRRD